MENTRQNGIMVRFYDPEDERIFREKDKSFYLFRYYEAYAVWILPCLNYERLDNVRR